MHAALWKLYRLRVRGSLRSMVGGLKSVRGAAMVVFTLLVLVLMLGPNLLMAAKVGRTGTMGQNVDAFREAIPVVMFLYVILSITTSLGARAIYFSPSEVDFLFPAPFSRRQILLYKILGSVTAATFVALFLPVSFVMHIRSWMAAATGFFLSVLMANSLTMCAQLIIQNVNERAFTRARRLFLGGLIAVAATALGQAVGRGLHGDWQETLLEVRHSPLAEVLLAPFAVFGNIITAPRMIPDALGCSALGVVLVVSVYALAIWLDANYLETAARVSQQIQDRKRRSMSDGASAARSKRTARSTRLPQPPWLGGVGPLAWRQVIQLLHGSRTAMVLAVIAVAAIIAAFVSGTRQDTGSPAVLPHLVIGMAAYATFLISAQTPLGFQGDFERMELLKSLPIGPVAMACGQMLVLAVILTLLQWLALLVTTIFAPAAAAELLVAGLFAFPFNWLLVGMDNLLFLLYPSPLRASGSEGFLKMGRVFLFMLAKFLVLGACGAVISIPAVVVFLVTGSELGACLIAWLTSLGPMLVILRLVAWAFQRFDAGTIASD